MHKKLDKYPMKQSSFVHSSEHLDMMEDILTSA